MVTSAEDLLDELFGPDNHPAVPPDPPWAGLDQVDAAILDAVAADLDMDGICSAAGLPVREARAVLTRLESAGRIRRDALGGYSPTASRVQGSFS